MNPDIGKSGVGVKTQFQKGTRMYTKRKANGTTIRNQLRYLIAQGFDMSKPDEALAKLKGMKKGGGGTVAHAVACRMLERALKKADPHMFSVLLDNAEGKLLQQTQEMPPPVPLPEDCNSEEEAAAAHAQFGG